MSQEIAKIGSKLIHSGMKIFTHCYSKTVIEILLQAKKEKKSFIVYTTETRPKLLGRRTTKALTAKKIPVIHMVDNAGPIAIKECDLFLFGAESITEKKEILNKIGTNILLETAKKYKIPSYCATHTNKLNKTPNPQKPTDVWKNPPKLVKIFNPGFEILNKKLITGYITEKYSLKLFRKAL